MVLSFRYHIFTITAIFAALGLGILVGSSIIGDDGLLEEQRLIINNISSDINSLKKENQVLTKGMVQLKEELKTKESMENKLLTLLLKDYFKGDKFFLIYSGLEDEAIGKLTELMKVTGAELDVLKYTKEISENELLNTENIQFDRYISWSIDKTLDERIKGLKLKDRGLIEYDKKDILGILYKLISEFNERDNKNV